MHAGQKQSVQDELQGRLSRRTDGDHGDGGGRRRLRPVRVDRNPALVLDRAACQACPESPPSSSEIPNMGTSTGPPAVWNGFDPSGWKHSCHGAFR